MATAQFQIEGGLPLKGVVEISAAKNAILPIMAAGLLCEAPLVLQKLPALNDVLTFSRLLRHMGVSVFQNNDGAVVVDASTLENTYAPYPMVREMRASILVLGPLLARFHKAKVALPGGCAIGARPINWHLKALTAMGAKIEIKQGYIHASGELCGAEFSFDDVTVTGTENIVMAAVLAKGRSVLRNVALEPEVIDLVNCLIQMGAKIEGVGSTCLEIEGVDHLRGGHYQVIGDRIEAVTYLIAAMMTKGSVRVVGVNPKHCVAAVDVLKQAGGLFQIGDDWIEVDMRGQVLKAVNVTTAPYPGFATDLQAQILALNSIAQGRSVVTETIFENRFMHVQELVRLGAEIKLQGEHATCQGVRTLTGAEVVASDLRAAASLVLAGLAAKGLTTIDNIHYLDRGYLSMEKKLRLLGARVLRMSEGVVEQEVVA